MDCDDYQRAALRTARATDAPDEFMHLVLGLVGEAGEIAEKVKKLVRDKKQRPGSARPRRHGGRARRRALVHSGPGELPGSLLDDVAQRNVDKLADRQRRAVLGGSGDNR
jgi:hypothetical protein